MEDKRKQILFRVYILYFFMLMAGIAIIGKIVYLQVVEGDELRAQAREITVKYRNIEAVRGSIHDENGRLLATSVPVFDVRMDVASPLISDQLFQSKVDSLARGLANLFKDKHYRTYRSELVSNRKSGNRYMLVKRNVTYDELKVIRDLPIFRRGKYKGGLIVIEKNKRVKPFRGLAARTIGYAREDYKVGLEGAYDNVLKGDSGRQLMQRVAHNVWVPVDQRNLIEPKNGNDIVTTLEVNIQDVAENALKDNLKFHKADHGSAVLMEVSTGEIKAIANLKRDTATGEYYEAYNYAIGENTEPGSTFKIASLMVGLEDGKFDLKDSIDTEGGKTEFFGQVMEDSHEGGYGVITVEQALELSSNVAVSKLIYQAYASDPEKFISGIKDMGLGSPTGIEIKGEADPLVKTPQNSTWSKVTLPWMSIGYEVELTPLQILTFYNAIANDGRMMKPMLVKEIRSAGKTTQKYNPVVLNSKIASEQTIRKAQRMLQGVVEEGTAKNLFNTVYEIAGKTGTAQIAKGSEGYDYTGHKASFVGYFPADNPRYTCAVVVNKPSRGLYYGGSVAAPVFKEIADKVYATQLDMQESKIDSSGSINIDFIAGHKADFSVISQKLNFPSSFMNPASEFVNPQKNSGSIRMKPVKIKSGYVPDVRGMGARDAIYLLKRAGMDVKMEGHGKVVKQSVRPGTRVVKGRKIKITLKV
ncbi:MAG: transpeptidase family protein [Bacteroidales bacterium]|nr:transpeptidase family protein [Bacteroidales bacterium]MCF8327211.1 transpeptidase family protein [Bacteroidales bacterium]